MRLQRVRLQNFRNHEDSTIECAPRINIFVGENGAGKTNIVEGIAYLSLTKSFYASQDGMALQEKKAWFRVSGEFESSRGINIGAEVRYDGEAGRKEYILNKTSLDRITSVIGRFPLVVLSPEQHGITFGLPSERRKFLDVVLSQSSSTYFDDVMQYRRALRHRNRILLDAKLAQSDPAELLTPWNESIALLGARITRKRAAFVEGFRKHLLSAYESLVAGRERPAIDYAPSVTAGPDEEIDVIKARIKEMMKIRMKDERRIGSSLVGPHRDELRFSIDNLDVRGFASQGQHKTFLVALKLAEFAFLKERTEEEPIMIFDDVFSELDEARTERLVRHMGGMEQVFVTTTDIPFWKGLDSEKNYMKIRVEAGKVLEPVDRERPRENA